MKSFTRSLLLTAVLIIGLACVLQASVPGFGKMPPGWQKVTGLSQGYCGQPDGICPDGDRENSYAWSMEVMGDYLYVGTSRDVLAPMLDALKVPTWPEELPYPTDMRGRIFRMNLRTCEWQKIYCCDEVHIPGMPTLGADLGYRMMKCSSVGGGGPMLYVGGLGLGLCRLLAIDCKGCVTPIFVSVASDPSKTPSIRSIAEHDGKLFWACEDKGIPTLFYSANPMKDAQTQSFCKISVPMEWFTKGCEIWDIISYNNALYVFLTPYDEKQLGFWCAKLVKKNGCYTWQLVVGDRMCGAKYPCGMGMTTNGAGVPVIFKGKCYVGTMDATAIRMMNEVGGGGPMPDINEAFSNLAGMQIFRFDAKDKWERVVPAAQITNPTAVNLIGGFVNPLNRYIWRFGVQGNMLYAGTFDSRTMMEVVGPYFGMTDITWWNPDGFDMYCSPDGKTWVPVAVDGFMDKWNYGVRSFATDPKSGDLFMGTANPFYGCQVWRKKAK